MNGIKFCREKLVYKRTDAAKKRCFEAAILAYMKKEGGRFSRTAAMFKEEAQLGDVNEMVVSGSVLEKGWEYLEYRRQLKTRFHRVRCTTLPVLRSA